ncbi:MAG: hypothetical protein PHY64_12010 [Eubacteriales bacterium]|nr:hypothetical protein [Eubacteriales bacterium]
MKKRIALCLLLLFVLLPFHSLADLQMTYFTDADATDVMVMGDDNSVLSTVIDKQPSGEQTEWTLNIVTGGADSGYFYVKNADGNWLRGSALSGLASLAGSAVTAAPADTPAPTITGTPAKPWEVTAYPRYEISIRPLAEIERVQSRCGPAKTYHGAGAYKTYKMTGTEALFIEGSYVLVDLDYTTVGKRIVYFPTSAFYSMRNVPSVTLQSVDAYTTSALTPTFGPGYDYDTFDEAAIASGTDLRVFFEENGWVFAEFECDLGVVRAWIPVEQVGY